MDERLFGMKDIQSYLRTRHNLSMSRFALWRLSRRDEDSFPVQHEIHSRRARVYAFAGAIDAWMDHNYPARTQ